MEEEEDALRRVLLLGAGLDRGRGEGTGEWKSGRVGEGERGEEKGEKGEKGIRWKGHHVEGQECASVSIGCCSEHTRRTCRTHVDMWHTQAAEIRGSSRTSRSPRCRIT